MIIKKILKDNLDNKRTLLGIGPMSKEIINSLDNFSKKTNKKIMLICSR